MSLSTNPLFRTPLEHIKAGADAHCWAAHIIFGLWLKSHRKLFLLGQCARYEFFTKNSLELNALILKDLRCKPLRECLLEVLKLQRELKSLEKKIKAVVKDEKKADAQFWALARLVKSVESKLD